MAGRTLYHCHGPNLIICVIALTRPGAPPGRSPTITSTACWASSIPVGQYGYAEKPPVLTRKTGRRAAIQNYRLAVATSAYCGDSAGICGASAGASAGGG